MLSNSAAWDGEHVSAGRLDSSLKRNNAALNRLKSGFRDPAVAAEVAGVSLSKYRDETLAALVEGVAKLGSSGAGVAGEVVETLHQRFGGGFTAEFALRVLAAVVDGVRLQLAVLVLVGQLTERGVFRGVGDLKGVEVPEYVARRVAKAPQEAVFVCALREVLRQGRTSIVKTVVAVHAWCRTASLPDGVSTSELFAAYLQLMEKVEAALVEKLAAARTRLEKESIRTGTVDETEVQQIAELELEIADCRSGIAAMGDAPQEVSEQPSLPPRLAQHPPVFPPKEADFYSREVELPPAVPFSASVPEALAKAQSKAQVVALAGSFPPLDSKPLRKSLTKLYDDAILGKVAFPPEQLRFLVLFLSLHRSLLSSLVESAGATLTASLRLPTLEPYAIRAYAEFTKFGLWPYHLPLHFLQTAVRRIGVGNNLAIVQMWLSEGYCGGVLLRDPQYARHTAAMLDKLRQTRATAGEALQEKIDGVVLVAEATLAGKEPVAVLASHESLAQQYLRYLVQESEGLVGQVAEAVRSMRPHANSSLLATLVDCLSAPHATRYDKIPRLVELVRKLKDMEGVVLPRVVDRVVERMEVSLANDWLRVRLALARYFSLLACLGVIPWEVVLAVARRVFAKSTGLQLLRTLATLFGELGSGIRPNKAMVREVQAQVEGIREYMHGVEVAAEVKDRWAEVLEGGRRWGMQWSDVKVEVAESASESESEGESEDESEDESDSSLVSTSSLDAAIAALANPPAAATSSTFHGAPLPTSAGFAVMARTSSGMAVTRALPASDASMLVRLNQHLERDHSERQQIREVILREYD